MNKNKYCFRWTLHPKLGINQGKDWQTLRSDALAENHRIYLEETIGVKVSVTRIAPNVERLNYSSKSAPRTPNDTTLPTGIKKKGF